MRGSRWLGREEEWMGSVKDFDFRGVGQDFSIIADVYFFFVFSKLLSSLEVLSCDSSSSGANLLLASSNTLITVRRIL